MIKELIKRFVQELAVPISFLYYAVNDDSQIAMAFVFPVFFLWMAINKYFNEMEQLKVKIKKTDPRAVIPTFAYSGDACMDLTAISKKVVEEDGYGFVEYDFGLAFSVPADHVMLIFPRSSISNTGMLLSNSVGCVDSGYTNSVKARFKWVRGSVQYEVGDRVAQFMIIPRPKIELEEVEELSETERNQGGFGSSNV